MKARSLFNRLACLGFLASISLICMAASWMSPPGGIYITQPINQSSGTILNFRASTITFHDGTVLNSTAGLSGIPGGISGQLQYNNGGTFGGTSGVNYSVSGLSVSTMTISSITVQSKPYSGYAEHKSWMTMEPSQDQFTPSYLRNITDDVQYFGLYVQTENKNGDNFWFRLGNSGIENFAFGTGGAVPNFASAGGYSAFISSPNPFAGYGNPYFATLSATKKIGIQKPIFMAGIGDGSGWAPTSVFQVDETSVTVNGNVLATGTVNVVGHLHVGSGADDNQFSFHIYEPSLYETSAYIQSSNDKQAALYFGNKAQTAFYRPANTNDFRIWTGATDRLGVSGATGEVSLYGGALTTTGTGTFGKLNIGIGNLSVTNSSATLTGTFTTTNSVTTGDLTVGGTIYGGSPIKFGDDIVFTDSTPSNRILLYNYHYSNTWEKFGFGITGSSPGSNQAMIQFMAGNSTQTNIAWGMMSTDGNDTFTEYMRLAYGGVLSIAQGTINLTDPNYPQYGATISQNSALSVGTDNGHLYLYSMSGGYTYLSAGGPTSQSGAYVSGGNVYADYFNGSGYYLTDVAPPSGYNNSNWDTAYGWGDHSQAGYVTGTPWQSEGYLTSTGSSYTTDTTISDGSTTHTYHWSNGVLTGVD